MTTLEVESDTCTPAPTPLIFRRPGAVGACTLPLLGAVPSDRASAPEDTDESGAVSGEEAAKCPDGKRSKSRSKKRGSKGRQPGSHTPRPSVERDPFVEPLVGEEYKLSLRYATRQVEPLTDAEVRVSARRRLDSRSANLHDRERKLMSSEEPDDIRQGISLYLGRVNGAEYASLELEHRAAKAAQM